MDIIRSLFYQRRLFRLYLCHTAMPNMPIDENCMLHPPEIAAELADMHEFTSPNRSLSFDLENRASPSLSEGSIYPGQAEYYYHHPSQLKLPELPEYEPGLSSPSPNASVVSGHQNVRCDLL